MRLPKPRARFFARPARKIWLFIVVLDDRLGLEHSPRHRQTEYAGLEIRMLK